MTAREALEEAVRLFEHYGLMAGRTEADPLAAGRWINNAHAALAASQPNRMGTTPEMQKMYDEFGESERFLFDVASKAYFKATETSDPQHWMEAALFAQQHRNALTKLNAALAATPAVGGALTEIADRLDQRAKAHEYAYNTGSGDTYRSDAKLMREAATALRHPAQPAAPAVGGEAHSDDDLIAIADEIGQLARDGRAIAGTVLGALSEVQKRAAAQPAPPLRGREAIMEQTIRDSIEALERNSTSAPVVECLKAALASPPEQPAASLEALASLLTIIDDLDQYQKRPERGDYGVECACCMGELFDADERMKIEAARTLISTSPPELPASLLRGREAQEKSVLIFRASALVLAAGDIDMQARTCGSVRAGRILTKISDRLRDNGVALHKQADAITAAPPEQPASPLQGRENLARKRAVEFILSHDPFGDVFSPIELQCIEGSQTFRYSDEHDQGMGVPSSCRCSQSLSLQPLGWTCSSCGTGYGRDD